MAFEAQSTLKHWQEKNHPWLELSDIYKETSDKIRVTVIPFYMGVRESQGTHWVRTTFKISKKKKTPLLKFIDKLNIVVVFCSGVIVFVWKIWVSRQ